MPQHLGAATIIVRDYDEAIAFYVGKMGFTLFEDTPIGDKRWVMVGPKGGQTRLLLARAASPREGAAIGTQFAGRVGCFLNTDNFARDHAAYVAAGIKFLEPPRFELYGTVAVFEDLYGNEWDLIEPKT